MQTKLQALASTAKRLTVAALAASAMLTAGCASAAVTGMTEANPAGLPQSARPDVIYVHTFAANAQQVTLDNRMSHKLMAMATGSNDAAAQAQAAASARDAVANEIVRELRAQGLNAVRSDAMPPANVNAMIIDGEFREIDEGNGRRRMLVGLGAGKSEVGAAVQVSYQPANGAAMPVRTFNATADSGHMPGVAETGGIGAAAGHVATAAGTGVAMHGASAATQHDTVQGDAARLGDAIAKAVAQTAGA